MRRRAKRLLPARKRLSVAMAGKSQLSYAGAKTAYLILSDYDNFIHNF
jgi:hypothetical protein